MLGKKIDKTCKNLVVSVGWIAEKKQVYGIGAGKERSRSLGDCPVRQDCLSMRFAQSSMLFTESFFNKGE